MDELKKLRNDLDMCDEILIDALRMRCQIIQEITNYKQKNGLPIYQAEEEERKKSKMLAKLDDYEYKKSIMAVYDSVLYRSKRIQSHELFGFNIFLIGFMGVGKSTVSNALQNTFAMDVVEMDEMIAKKNNMSISEIFDLHGEEYFRNEETNLLKEVGNEKNKIVSCGGGVAMREVFAKLGSDYKKPDATTVISRENWRSIVWPLPVGDLLYVGGAAQKLLGQYGVKTIGQLAACKKETLETLMGKMGTQLYEYANGLDSAPVRARLDAEPVKSVGNGTTFPQNLTTRIQVRSGIAVLADSVATRLRREGLYAGGIQVTVRDPAFHDRSRQKQLPAPTHLILDLTNAAMALTEELWTPPAPIRALTVTAIHLSPDGEAYEQADLFDPTAGQRNARQEKLESAMDAIRKKYGGDAIVYGAARPEKEEDPLP